MDLQFTNHLRVEGFEPVTLVPSFEIVTERLVAVGSRQRARSRPLRTHAASVQPPYSAAMARTGSTRAARRPGSQHATAATSNSVAATPATVSGSVAVTPNR